MDSHAPPTSHDTHIPFGSGLGLGHGPTIVKPIALKAMEGFGLLTSRSKSAPPIPRDQAGKQQKSDVSPNDNEPKMLPASATNEKMDVPYLDPATHPINRMPTPGTEPLQPRSQPQTPMFDPVTPHSSTSNQYLSVVTPPRTASPSSLEAYFLERKRRGGSGGGAAPRIVTPVPGAKGKVFKSSPLSPVERDITDAAKSKGTSSATKLDDGNDPSSEIAVEGKLD